MSRPRVREQVTTGASDTGPTRMVHPGRAGFCPSAATAWGGALRLDLTLVAVAEGTKTCPECAEEVKAAANVCRFCGHRFDATAKPTAPTAPDSEASENLALLGYLFAVLFPIVGLIIGIVLLGRGRSRAGWQIVVISFVVMTIAGVALGVSLSREDSPDVDENLFEGY